MLLYFHCIAWFTSIVEIAEIIGINRIFLESQKIVLIKLLRNNLKKSGSYSNKEKYSQDKLQLYTSFKEHPGFENYPNESNPKFHQAITKIRTIVHITSQLKQVTLKTKIKLIEYAHWPLCCDGIGNELHRLIECKNKAITKTRSEFSKPFRWKGIQKLSQEEFCKVILACQNDEMVTETGVLCLKIQETYQSEAM